MKLLDASCFPSRLPLALAHAGAFFRPCRLGYLRSAGLDAPVAMPDTRLWWKAPPRGGGALAAWAAFFRRRARAIGVSASSFFGSSLMRNRVAQNGANGCQVNRPSRNEA